MPRRLGSGLLLAAALGSVAFAQAASAQVTSRFDGQYSGELTLTRTIDGDCTEPPRGALYPLTISGGQVRFAYLPRFATTLTGSVAENGGFRASARTKRGRVEMTGQIRGNAVRAQIVSPSCRYDFATRN
jgi:hypothetical protein